MADRSVILFIISVVPAVFTVLWVWSGSNAFRWDAAWYSGIVSNGYQFDGNILRQQNVAFLPGYPSLIFLIHSMTGLGIVGSQYLASLICYLVGSYCLYRALSVWFTPRLGTLAVLVFSVNPFAIYLFNGYSESLFYLLCSVFLLGISTNRLWLSSVALSFALVTRPHAVSLYPVLMYKIAIDNWPIVGTAHGKRINRLRATQFFRTTVDQIFLTLIFPIGLTLYWYIKFSDPLVYLNAITAWNGVGTSGVKGQLKFLFHHFTHFHSVAKGEVAGFPVVIASPGNIASVNVLANVFALFYLVRQKRFELALFCVGLLAFWFLKSVPGDSGRHALMLLAMPIALASLLVRPAPAQLAADEVPQLEIFRFWSIRVLVIGFLLLSFAHFCAFALLQLKGGWIS